MVSADGQAATGLVGAVTALAMAWAMVSASGQAATGLVGAVMALAMAWDMVSEATHPWQGTMA